MRTAMKSFISFIKKEAVLSAAAFLAVLSAFFVRPDAEYAGYIDYRVLALLFCLMLVVAAFKDIGMFSALGARMLKHAHSTRSLSMILVFLCFFSSMFITNDVALITFVPFAVMMLSLTGQKKLMIPVITLQTIAANLGSMLTPVGNPQNLYLYSTYHIPIQRFLLLMLPLSAVSAIMLIIAVLLLKNNSLDTDTAPKDAHISGGFLAVIYILLFLVCIACVIHVIDYPIMLAIVVITMLVCNHRLFRNVDYYLLLTFVCFFIFIGNMERIPAVSDIMSRLISGREVLLGIVFSQVISNVPATILLSGFTSNYVPLLYGVNIGGLGTLIASLASIISYRGYCASDGADKGRYILIFTVYNLIFLAVLSITCILL